MGGGGVTQNKPVLRRIQHCGHKITKKSEKDKFLIFSYIINSLN